MSFRSLFHLSSSIREIPLLPIYAPQNGTPAQRPYQTAPANPHPQSLSNMTPDRVPHSDALIAVSRQEAHLQSTLQHLLDAQSEGLLAGLTGSAPQDEISSAGSRTPTTAYSSPPRPQNARSVVPVRQPARKKVSLKGARRGIAHAISDLASLKIEEGRILEDEMLQRAETLSTAQRFETQMVGLKGHIESIESEDTTQIVQRLKSEEKALNYEIQELESRLWEMKAKHRHLLQEIEGLESSVQSKLSSYKSALTLAEKESRKFLERPPIGGNRTATTTGLWALPAERRTLHMVKEQYAEERNMLRRRFDDVKTERGALEHGSGVWNEVVEDVNGVERLLREEMREMQTPLVPESGNGKAIGGMKKVLDYMSKARSRIESKLEVSEARDWKLLICCIGAELEAMSEGQIVLQNALDAAQKSGGQAYGNAPTIGPEPVSSTDLSARLEGLEKQGPAKPGGILDRSEDEDDGPGPDLLISSVEV